MTIINSIRAVFIMPVQGLTNGSQPVAGYNYGARLYSRVRQAVRFSVGGRWPPLPCSGWPPWPRPGR